MHAYTCVTTTPGFQRSHADKAAVHKCERPPHSKTAWAAFKKKSYPIFGYLWFVVALEAM
jgi:hypothetical protein